MQRDPAWLDHVERFGIKSLIKLVIAVFGLLYIAALVAFLPGLERLSALLAVPLSPIITTGVTIVLLILLYKIAVQARTLIEHIQTDARAFRNLVAAVVFWCIILAALIVAYEGFSEGGRYLLAQTEYSIFYPLLFVITASVPVTILLVEIGVFLQTKRHRGQSEQRVSRPDVRTNAEQVHELLETSGGRVYQSDIASAAEWSSAKVSYVLSDMEANGSIVRYQVGRQKIVCLPGEEPDVISSEAPNDPTG